ncbi:MAG: hypothetical protein JSV66_13595 [Trueperaceae bacterium]|nr:MAG: hypothetical protein JSV66_13595 [Trueperaceae bacterium]
MTIRTQVTLDPELQRRARQKAAAMGISFAEYVRRLVARDLEGLEPEPVDISAVFNLGDSGGSDIARDKDRMLGEAASTGKRA